MTVKDAIRTACGDVDRPVILFNEQDSLPEIVLEALETGCLDRNWRTERPLHAPDGRTFNVLATG